MTGRSYKKSFADTFISALPLFTVPLFSVVRLAVMSLCLCLNALKKDTQVVSEGLCQVARREKYSSLTERGEEEVKMQR